VRLTVYTVGSQHPTELSRNPLPSSPATVQRQFQDRVQSTIVAFAEQGLNAILYYENKSFARNVFLGPSSAITGEGVPDMINASDQLDAATHERPPDVSFRA